MSRRSRINPWPLRTDGWTHRTAEGFTCCCRWSVFMPHQDIELSILGFEIWQFLKNAIRSKNRLEHDENKWKQVNNKICASIWQIRCVVANWGPEKSARELRSVVLDFFSHADGGEYLSGGLQFSSACGSLGRALVHTWFVKRLLKLGHDFHNPPIHFWLVFYMLWIWVF